MTQLPDRPYILRLGRARRGHARDRANLRLQLRPLGAVLQPWPRGGRPQAHVAPLRHGERGLHRHPVLVRGVDSQGSLAPRTGFDPFASFGPSHRFNRLLEPVACDAIGTKLPRQFQVLDLTAGEQDVDGGPSSLVLRPKRFPNALKQHGRAQVQGRIAV